MVIAMGENEDGSDGDCDGGAHGENFARGDGGEPQ